MFNGIIYNRASVQKILRRKSSAEITLKTSLFFGQSEIGSSLCCNGTCLTITRIKKNLIYFYLSKETLKKTNFKSIQVGNFINIEKSLNYGNKISGHYVQGHTDTTGKVANIVILNKTWVVTFEIKKKFQKYLIEKGSIAINGVSLTISKIIKNGFEINIIPHTLKLTNLIKLKKKNSVNIEFDIFSKYLLNLNR
jgi:riboflavin synthase|tara:strand:- start:292 stop:876 length:585 start_codon:yes stop_codon:yes gene_type:complete